MALGWVSLQHRWRVTTARGGVKVVSIAAPLKSHAPWPFNTLNPKPVAFLKQTGRSRSGGSAGREVCLEEGQLSVELKEEERILGAWSMGGDCFLKGGLFVCFKCFFCLLFFLYYFFWPLKRFLKTLVGLVVWMISLFSFCILLFSRGV